jgi:arginine decarboxylase
MLDPIKVGIVSPGLNDDGTWCARGIPGPLVSAYLASYGTVVARTTDFMVLVMFSVGVTKGAWRGEESWACEVNACP